MLNAFVWSPRFETGIELVDTQHKALVEILNNLIEGATAERGLVREEVVGLLDRLVAYAKVHFADEEQLMTEQGCTQDHVEGHRVQHQDFARQVAAARETLCAGEPPADFLEGLARFVTSWLSFHILGSDMEMARQLRRQGGDALFADPALAAQDAAARTSVLVEAMHGLYDLMADRNLALSRARDELAELNATLEERVRTRTAELEQALDEVGRTRVALSQAERMSAIGQLAAGVAHEINNPIGFVTANVATLGQYLHSLIELSERYHRLHDRLPFSESDRAKLGEMKAKADYDFVREDLPALLDETRAGLERITRIVAAMQTFSNMRASPWQTCDVNTVVESAIGPLRGRCADRIEIVLALSPLPMIEASPEQIAMVVAALFDNAIAAIEGSGRITITTGVNGNELVCEVADTGQGIATPDLERVFEPFFTTKAVGKGIGLGLSMAYQIVAHHRGTFEVSSEAGKGARFAFRLPLNRCKRSTAES